MLVVLVLVVPGTPEQRPGNARATTQSTDDGVFQAEQQAHSKVLRKCSSCLLFSKNFSNLESINVFISTTHTYGQYAQGSNQHVPIETSSVAAVMPIYISKRKLCNRKKSTKLFSHISALTMCFSSHTFLNNKETVWSRCVFRPITGCWATKTENPCLCHFFHKQTTGRKTHIAETATCPSDVIRVLYSYVFLAQSHRSSEGQQNYKWQLWRSPPGKLSDQPITGRCFTSGAPAPR